MLFLVQNCPDKKDANKVSSELSLFYDKTKIYPPLTSLDILSGYFYSNS
jgi:hypothetical protein